MGQLTSTVTLANPLQLTLLATSVEKDIREQNFEQLFESNSSENRY